MVLEEQFRAAWPRVVRVLAGWCGSLDVAEEYAAEAFSRAVAQTHLPDDLAAWCVQVAKRACIDDRRRAETFARLAPSLAREPSATAPGVDVAMDPENGPVGLDDRLALLFVACDEALPRGAQLVLALRVVCGLSIVEVAHHLGIKESAAAARLTRAKAALASARDGFHVPGPAERRQRLPVVLDCVAGMFNVAHREGFAPEDALSDTARQALSIADALCAEFPSQPEVRALRSLVVLGLARRPGRVDESGAALTLDEVDRTRWDRRLVETGLSDAATATELLGDAHPGRYVLEAAISGLHTVAPSAQSTDWRRIVMMYEALQVVWPSPAVLVAGLAARARAAPDDTAAVEAELSRLSEEGPSYARRDATFALADLHWRTGRRRQSAAAYARLAEEARSEQVRRFCLRRASL